MLREVERNLEAVVAGGDIDPKVQVVLHYLRDRQWLGDKRRDHLQPVPDDGGVGLGGALRGVPERGRSPSMLAARRHSSSGAKVEPRRRAS